jgi:molybdenum cofactor biosynthesis enzyme MoaA
VRQVSFYDDALLVDFDKRLRPVLEAVISDGIHMVFHTPNAMHAGLVDNDVACLLYQAGFRTLRISLETVDVERQRQSGGKVVSGDVENAVCSFTAAGYRPKEIGVYLLAALPGQSVQEVRAGVEFVKSLGAKPYIAEMSPIPGTEVWEEFMKMGVVDSGMDPLLTNNSLFWHWSGFCSHKEFHELKALCR